MPSLTYHILQKAIYDKLLANSSLMATVSGVYNHVPQHTIFPYIIIGKSSASNISNLYKSGADYEITINIWSQEAGSKQTSDIMEKIYALLHEGNLSISGKSVIAMRIENTSIEIENDGMTYKGTIDLRVIVMDV
jgi:hypothetical protein